MSVANGFNRVEGAAAAALRRCAASVMTALTVLARPARGNARLLSLSPRQLAIAGGAFLAVYLLSMMTIDAAAIRGVGHLPSWIISFIDDITFFVI